MLTNDELRAVAEQAHADVSVELGMWDMAIDHCLEPGWVRAIVRILARDYGMRREGGEGPVGGALRAPPATVDRIAEGPVAKVDWSGLGSPAAALMKSRGAANGHVAEAVDEATEAATATAERSEWAMRLALRGELADVVYQLETRLVKWSVLDNGQRWPIVAAFVRRMRRTGVRTTMTEADRTRPDWMPTSSAWCLVFGGIGWHQLVEAALAGEKQPPAAEAAKA